MGEPPEVAVVVCSSPRTGSGLLCAALWSTGCCGRPDEYLSPSTRREYEELWGSSGDAAYAEGVLTHGTTPNGVFSIKIQAEHLGSVGWLGADRSMTALARSVHFCLVTRRDKVRQAVSAYTAATTGRYRHRRSDPVPPELHVPYDFEAIRRHLGEATAWDHVWRAHFERFGIEPRTVGYEDDLRSGCAGTVRHLLGEWGIAPPEGADAVAVEPDLLRQSDDRSDELVERFLADLAGRGR